MKREKTAKGAQKKELPHIFVILLVVIIFSDNLHMDCSGRRV